MSEISQNDLLAALHEVMSSTPENTGGFTTQELIAKLGCGQEKVRSLLRRMGPAVQYGRRQVPRLGGGMTIVPCYFLHRPEP